MPKAVRFNGYGGIDVLRVVEVERPVPRPGQVLIRVKAAGVNPGESSIREGLLHQRGARLEVHVLPPQAQQFALAHSSVDGG